MKDLVSLDISHTLSNYTQNQIAKQSEADNLNENSLGISKKNRRSKYLKIDDEKRKIIIFEVMVMNNPLKQVCLKHDINFSSAKNVIQIYKKEGRLEKKVVRARKAKKHDESKNDPNFSSDEEQKQLDDDSLQKKESSFKAKNSKQNPQCGLMLFLQEDDSYRVNPTKQISDSEKSTIEYLHTQNMTQSSSFAFSTNYSSEVSN